MKLNVLKTLSIILLIAMCAVVNSCHSKKDIQRDVCAVTDSVATAANHRTFATLDSAFIGLNFDFDTLDVTVDRLLMGDTTETFRLRAVKGRVASNRSQFSRAVEAKTRLDSTAYKISSADRSAEHTATTVAYEPPKSTSLLIFALLLVGIIAYIIFHRRIS